MVFLVPALHSAVEASGTLHLCAADPFLALFHEPMHTREGCMGPEHTGVGRCVFPHASFPRNPESTWSPSEEAPSSLLCSVKQIPLWCVLCLPVTSSGTLLLGEQWHDHGSHATQRKPCFYNMPECSSLPSDSVPAALCGEKVGAKHPFLTDGDWGLGSALGPEPCWELV